MTTSTRTTAGDAADELVRALPSERMLKAAPGDRPGIEVTQCLEASWIGATSVDFALGLAASDLFPAGGGLAVENLLHPALQAAGRTYGSGVLGDVRPADASVLADDPDSTVFTLLDDGAPVGWFAVRERQGARPAVSGTPDPDRLGRISGVEMALAVEIGRTRMTVRDILNLEPGAVVELDRSAGAPADVLLNGRLIAHGEVVVVDQDYAVRITRILDAQGGTL